MRFCCADGERLIARNGENGLTVHDGSGNQTSDLSCTPDLSAHGDAAGVSKMFCPAFNQSPQPLPGLHDQP